MKCTNQSCTVKMGQFYESWLKVLNLCETLSKLYTFLLNELESNIKPFVRLNIIYLSITSNKDFNTSLQEATDALVKNNFPLPISFSNLAIYFNLIEFDRKPENSS